MTYDAQESTLRRAAEFGIHALRQRSAEVKILAQRAKQDGNDGWAEALVKNVQSIDEEIREMEEAYRMKHLGDV